MRFYEIFYFFVNIWIFYAAIFIKTSAQIETVPPANTNSLQNVCEQLVAPYLGTISGKCDGSSAGDTCTVHCQRPYKLAGPARKVCNGTNLSWMPQSSQMCLDKHKRCRRMDPPTHGYFLGTCYDYVGSACSVECKPGYEIVGSHTRYCVETGTWEPAHPRCQRLQCPVLKDPQHGRIVDECENYLRSSCRFACDEGYQLLGSKTRRCTSVGVWDGEPTRCIKACPALPPLRFGAYLSGCRSGLYSRTCRIGCRRGYKLDQHQNNLISCVNGSWESPLPPRCRRVRCNPVIKPGNGSYKGYCNPGFFGKPCVFTCKVGYELVGRKSIYCKNNGHWSSAAPSCIAYVVNQTKDRCLDIVPHHMYSLDGKCERAKSGEKCHINCLQPKNPDFNDGVTITCLENGSWTSANLTCDTSQICCPPPQKPRNGSILSCDPEKEQSVGAICEQICNHGYEPASGTNALICMPTGEWEGIRLKCRKQKMSSDTKFRTPSGRTGINGSVIKGANRIKRKRHTNMVLRRNKIHITF